MNDVCDYALCVAAAEWAVEGIAQASIDDEPIERRVISCDWHVGQMSRYLAEREGIQPAIVSSIEETQ